MKIPTNQTLWIRSCLGKWLDVTAIFTTVEAANTHMETHAEGVIAEIDGLVFLAALSDEGI